MEHLDLKDKFIMHCTVGIILRSIRRNGIDKTIEDLRGSCRLGPEDNEHVYQDVLSVLNEISETHEVKALKKYSN